MEPSQFESKSDSIKCVSMLALAKLDFQAIPRGGIESDFIAHPRAKCMLSKARGCEVLRKGSERESGVERDIP